MEKIKNDIMRIVEDLKYYLYDVTFEKEGNDFVLRIMIENETYIDIDDCVLVSKHISDWLDKEDPIEEAYMLEVTSSGAEHELRNSDEVKRSIGKTVYIETMEQKFDGVLESFKDNILTIKQKNKKVTKVNYMDVSFIRLAVVL